MKFFTLLLVTVVVTAVSGFQPAPVRRSQPSALSARKIPPAAAAAVSLLVTASQAAAEDAVELADLPPPFVPVAFGIALLGGVGWLTASLGDVMSEEAGLGLQSGARAKKEMDRNRSSYFKK